MSERHLRRSLAAASVALVLVTLAISPVAGRSRDPGQTTSWIVMLAGGVPALEKGPSLATAAGGQMGLAFEYAINGFQLLGTNDAAAALRRNPSVLAVTPDRPITLNETLPFGVERIGAYVPDQPGGAYQAGYRGDGARIAILDTGIDMDHPDLEEGIDAANGKNCVSTKRSPNDGHGHGTHVAGSAAAPANGVGVVGVAPEATLVPIKMFDDSGNSSESRALCALNHVIKLNTDGNAANNIDVASMSWGESRAWGSCATDPLHAAICNASAAGVVLVGGAGNEGADAGNFVPAAFPEVISVSAIADFDGDPGGLEGCAFVLEMFSNECDDTFAFFSNSGTSVDVTAPGVHVYSTWKSGGYEALSGTSMATPHVSGVAALMKSVDHALTTAEVRALLRLSGECPSGAWADADAISGCNGQGLWTDDPDGIAEPLVNALRAAQLAETPPPAGPPESPQLTAQSGAGQISLSWTAPYSGGSPVTGYVVYRGATAGGASEYATLGDVTTFADTGAVPGATYYYQVAAANALGTGPRSNEVAAYISLPWEPGVQGDWVGNYGVDGYALLGWNNGTDLVALPQASLSLDQGSRWVFSAGTADVRALENAAQTERRATTWFDATSVRLHLTFSTAYSGTLHLYAIDWSTVDRRQTVVVDDGSGPRTIAITSAFNNGAWMHIPINVPAGGVVSVRADRTGGANAVLAGLFLGGP